MILLESALVSDPCLVCIEVLSAKLIHLFSEASVKFLWRQPLHQIEKLIEIVVHGRARKKDALVAINCHRLFERLRFGVFYALTFVQHYQLPKGIEENLEVLSDNLVACQHNVEFGHSESVKQIE